MKCVACGKQATNVVPLTPAMCDRFSIQPQSGVLCINCTSDIAMHGQWTGLGWAWLKKVRDRSRQPVDTRGKS